MINLPVINNLVSNDPLEEDRYMPVKSITHKYKNRALFLVTLKCHTYCDYCTRERKVNPRAYRTEYEEGIEYIKNNPEITDVILSGGDPLTLSNDKLKNILLELKKMPHVKIIRIHTKITVHYPKRVTDELIEALGVIDTLYINLHISKLSELHDGCKEAIRKLKDAGFILGCQSVLLRGVNDDEKHLSELFMNLLELGVKPYYLYQMDKTTQYDKYIVEEKRGMEIMNYLRRNISGMAVPRYILDTNEYKKVLI